MINIINKLMNNDKKNMFINVLLFLFVILFSCLKLSNLTVIFAIFGSALLLYNVKKSVNNYFSISFIFTAFHVLYGLAGPVSVVWFNGLTATYGSIYNIFPYMIAYSLVSIFYYIGYYLYYHRHNGENMVFKDLQTETKKIDFNEYRKYFLFVAICGFMLVLIFELINFIRVDGINTVLKGKAIYQAAVDELKFTLPSSELSYVSLASLCVYIFISLKKKLKISKKIIIIMFIMMIPYLCLLVFLGKRGNILSFILMVLLVLFQYKPMNRLNKKVIIGFVGLYFILGSMFAIRNYTNLIFKDFGQFTSKVFTNENLISAFNPGQNEFGCTFGNFNKLYISDDYNFLYGDSYIKGITHFIPSYLFPGEKPQLLMYKFRDKYFAFKAEISSIAGTAFSSILETYWNFGYFGAIIYLIYGYIIGYIEFTLKKKSMFHFLVYASFIPYIYEFHRSDFGHISFEIIITLAIILFISIFYKYVFKKNKFINKVIKTLMSPNIVILAMMNAGFFKWLSDKSYLKLKYRLNLGKKLNLNNPITYNEKIQWLKLNDRNNQYTLMVDKIEAKKIVAKVIGKEYLIPTIGEFNTFDEIDFSKLPNKFVIKCTHDSGGLIICRDKNKFDCNKARKIINKKMRKNYYYLSREWPYKNIKPRIIIEEYMDISNSDVTITKDKRIITAESLQEKVGLLDYKFMCFDGDVKFLFLDIGVIGKGTHHAKEYYRNVYDADFNLMSFRETRDNYPIKIKKPKNYDEMLKIARKLSANYPHLRVDLYNIDGKIYFGEMTLYHGSGLSNIFIPEIYDEKIGEYINLEKYFGKK